MRLLRADKGFSLIETIICTVLTGTMLVAALSTVSAARWSQYHDAQTCLGMSLAQSILAEIEPLAYADPNTPLSFGLEANESSSLRSSLNDVDDYHGLELNPITDINGVSLDHYEGWTVEVTVSYAEATDPEQDAVSGDEGIKRITIEASYGGRPWASLTFLKTRVEP